MSRDRRLDAVNRTRGAEYWKEPPPRWKTCPPVGDVIQGMFFPFKTPLDSKYDPELPLANRFNVESVYSAAKELKKDITVWIDLAKTSRFYEQNEVEKRGTNYRKMACGGHEESPTKQQTDLFIEACKKMFGNVEDNPNSVIGIHCTHGFNRTGFMICAYLVEECDWSVQAALNEFAKARPPGIYKQNYIADLYERYDDPDQIPNAPDLPSWCFDETDGLDDEGNDNNNGRTELSEPSNDGAGESAGDGGGNSDAVFMEGVGGVSALSDPELVHEIQTTCRNLCGWRRNGFPGCQPVSMGVSNIKLIRDDPYYVSWKADGVRYMLFVDGEQRAFFLDRNNCVFQINGMSFPQAKASGQLENTLMDGEMILDIQPDKTTRARYLIYDVVHSLNIEVGKLSFDKRCDYIKKNIIKPRDDATVAGRLRKEHEPFSIRWKEFWPLTAVGRDQQGRPTSPVYMAEKLLGKKFSENMSHEVDGLVFQPVPDPYTAGRCDRVLKWKPPLQCTIDFRLQVKTEGGVGMIPSTKGLLYVNQQTSPFGVLRNFAGMRKFEGKILECRFDMASKKWIFVRERTDKSFPNAKSTADSVYDGIIRPLTQDMLFQYIREHSYGHPPVKRPREDDHHNPQVSQRPVQRPRIETHDPGAPRIF